MSQTSTVGGVGQLTRLSVRVKHPSLRGQIETALRKAAESAGVAQGDLEDIAVPTCGLQGVGELDVSIGD